MLGGSDDAGQAARWARRRVQEAEGVVPWRLRMPGGAGRPRQRRVAEEEGGGGLQQLQALLASPLCAAVGKPYLCFCCKTVWMKLVATL